MTHQATPKTIVIRDSAIPLTHCSAALRNGSLSDPEGKEGATRLLLRLMRRAAAEFTAEQIDEQIDRLGATLGIDANRSVAGFHGAVIARSRDPFHELLAQVLTRPRFDSDEFDRLKKEALAEWHESLDDDSTLARRYFSRAVFEGHPYGRLAGGCPDSLARVELDDLKELYPQLLRAEQLRFAFAGDVDEELCNAFVDKVRAELPQGPALSGECASPPIPEGRRLLFVDKPERSQTQIIIGGLGSRPQDSDHTALYAGHMIFGGTFSSRLSQEVRGKRGWSYGAYSNLPFDRQRQAFSLWTFPQSSDAAECIALELRLLEELIEKGVSEEELDATKAYLENSHAFTLDTAAKRASLALDSDLYDLPPSYFEGHVARVKSLTVSEVNTALRSRLSAENLRVVVVGTEGQLLSEIQRAIPRLGETEVVPFDSPC